MVYFRDFVAADVVAIDVQDSQVDALGVFTVVRDLEHGRQLEASGPAWTAIGDDGRVLVCAGLGTIFPGHAVLWALLTRNIGAAHVAITRFARARIAAAGCARIEAIVRADVEAEGRWATLVGLSAAHVLRKWGPLATPHVLYERIG